MSSSNKTPVLYNAVYAQGELKSSIVPELYHIQSRCSGCTRCCSLTFYTPKPQLHVYAARFADLFYSLCPLVDKVVGKQAPDGIGLHTSIVKN